MSVKEFAEDEMRSEDEMRRARFSEDDIRAMRQILDIFFDNWDSGGAVYVMQDVFDRLIACKPLTPITGEDDEWVDVGNGTLQNKQLSSVFKDPRFFDGKQAYDIDNGGPLKAITFSYNPDNSRVSSPEMVFHGKK